MTHKVPADLLQPRPCPRRRPGHASAELACRTLQVGPVSREVLPTLRILQTSKTKVSLSSRSHPARGLCDANIASKSTFAPPPARASAPCDQHEGLSATTACLRLTCHIAKYGPLGSANGGSNTPMRIPDAPRRAQSSRCTRLARMAKRSITAATFARPGNVAVKPHCCYVVAT